MSLIRRLLQSLIMEGERASERAHFSCCELRAIQPRLKHLGATNNSAKTKRVAKT